MSTKIRSVSKLDHKVSGWIRHSILNTDPLEKRKEEKSHLITANISQCKRAITITKKAQSLYSGTCQSRLTKRNQGKQTRHSSERQGEEDLPAHRYAYPKWKKKHFFKNSSKTFEVQGSRNRNWENMGTKNNKSPSGHWCSRASQEGDWKLHQQDPRNHRNNRASEDCPPWDCSHTQEVTIHQAIHETYYYPKFMEWSRHHKRKEHDSKEN